MDRLEGLGHDDSAAFLENQNMLQFLLQSFELRCFRLVAIGMKINLSNFG